MATIKSGSLSATFSDIGARLMAVEVGGIDVVFGPPMDFDPHKDDGSAGATCGRHAGRISGSHFTLDGHDFPLTPTSDGVQLHGGPNGFGKLKWASRAGENEIVFSLLSPDGDQGFPGALKATATYGIKGNVLWCELAAITSKPTVVNLTNHVYWNLKGPTAGKDAAFTQEAEIKASYYLPLDSHLLPTGEIEKVADTRFDFRKPRLVGEAYDNYFCLDGNRGMLKFAAALRDPASNRRMEMWTTEGGVQFYNAAHWNPAMRGKGGPLQQHQAIAMEAQNYPDAPSHANFPSSFLRPGQHYRNRIEWRFT